MNQHICLTNHFLIAMPVMDDPNFFKAVAYICEHTEEGAVAIVINRPLDLNLSDVLTQMNIKCDMKMTANYPILSGGPMHPERGFVIHDTEGKWDSSFETGKGISVTTSKDILNAIAENKGPKNTLTCLGHAGWAAGQLENELSNNIWLNTPAKKKILFNTPYKDRWAAAAKLIGIDINTLSSDVGHA